MAEHRLKEQNDVKTEEIGKLLKQIDEARTLNEIQDKKTKRLEGRLEDETKQAKNSKTALVMQVDDLKEENEKMEEQNLQLKGIVNKQKQEFEDRVSEITEGHGRMMQTLKQRHQDILNKVKQVSQVQSAQLKKELDALRKYVMSKSDQLQVDQSDTIEHIQDLLSQSQESRSSDQVHERS